MDYQAGGSGLGIPDLVIRGLDSEGRRFCAAFELKIDAGLTAYQKTGYESFLAAEHAKVRRFVLIGPQKYCNEYELPPNAFYFSTEDFLRTLADAGGHIRLADIAQNLRDHFVEHAVPYAEFKEAVHGGLNEQGGVSTPLWQLGQELKALVRDLTDQRATCGPARWGGKGTRQPFYGFFISIPNEGHRIESNVAWIGFWSYGDDDDVDLYVQLSKAELIEALRARGHALFLAKGTPDSLWRLNLSGYGNIRASTIMDQGLTSLVRDLVSVVEKTIGREREA